MPQEFCVLRCYTCKRFQVHIMKKSKKWDCKMCGAKQSFIKIHSQGDARECREIVQKLNMAIGLESEKLPINHDLKQENEASNIESHNTTSNELHYSDQQYDSAENQLSSTGNKKVSKWACFLDPEDE